MSSRTVSCHSGHSLSPRIRAATAWMYNPCYVNIAGNNDYSPLSVRVTNEVEVTGTVQNPTCQHHK